MVKKINKEKLRHEYRGTGVVSYLDDIEKFTHSIRERGFELSIKDEDYIFDDIDELIEIKGLRPKYFCLIAKDLDSNSSFSEVEMTFSKDTVRLEAWKSKELFLEIEELIKNCESGWVKKFDPVLVFILLFFLTLIGVAVIPQTQFFGSLLLFIWFSFFIITVGNFLHKRLELGVFLVRKHKGGFFRRNSEKLLLSTIGVVLGLFLKYLWDLIF